jgi:hypothetical protein
VVEEAGVLRQKQCFSNLVIATEAARRVRGWRLVAVQHVKVA